MHIKNSLLSCIFLALIISITPVNAAGIAPALTTPAEQVRQQQLESQEQQRQQEILKSLRQQQEIKPDVRDEVGALKQTALKASLDIPDNETPCFAIHKIEMVGDDAAKFQFALDGGGSTAVNALDNYLKKNTAIDIGIVGKSQAINVMTVKQSLKNIAGKPAQGTVYLIAGAKNGEELVALNKNINIKIVVISK